LRKKNVKIAQKNKIPYKVDIHPMYGSDAAAALRTGIDAKHMLFGPGVDASHSFERLHKDSLNATTELTVQYILEK
ncbi:MAG: peptidase M42, partial [Candidatus Delongbacteria bacterium]|nr:peptidase M42 [Candidatus Delongbacteria bacterium]